MASFRRMGLRTSAVVYLFWHIIVTQAVVHDRVEMCPDLRALVRFAFIRRRNWSDMTPEREKELKKKAVRVREGVLIGTHAAKSGHPGGSLSAADLFTYLYEDVLNIDPQDPRKPDRDRFVLSKGHCAPGLYAELALRGYFPFEDLQTLRHIGSYLQGHPNMNTVPGVDMSTGSLGQGLSVAAGMARGAKIKDMDFDTYVLCGDGELAEGQNWEALAFAKHYGLDNLCVIADINGLQIDGWTKDVLNMEPLNEKFQAFGADVMSIDGHDFNELEKAIQFYKDNKAAHTGRPTVILMNTVKGKGISFMENVASWHGVGPNDEQFAAGMKELEEARKELEA